LACKTLFAPSTYLDVDEEGVSFAVFANTDEDDEPLEVPPALPGCLSLLVLVELDVGCCDCCSSVCCCRNCFSTIAMFGFIAPVIVGLLLLILIFVFGFIGSNLDDGEDREESPRFSCCCCCC